MSNQEYNYSLDPFLPFISTYDSTPTPVIEQDPWVNATFGFEGDVNFFNNTMLDSFNVPMNNNQVNSFMNGQMDQKQKEVVPTATKPKSQTKQKKAKEAAIKAMEAELDAEYLDNDEKLDDPILDKRRRNTLASARFRIRKKQKELELERNAKELVDKVDELNKKVEDLEKENKWLRSLLLEKSSR